VGDDQKFRDKLKSSRQPRLQDENAGYSWLSVVEAQWVGYVVRTVAVQWLFNCCCFQGAPGPFGGARPEGAGGWRRVEPDKKDANEYEPQDDDDIH
jgi:hypothetical protein